MVNVSNEYKKYIYDTADSDLPRNFTAKATIVLADSTVLDITEADIVENGLKINDGTSNGGSFQIGAAKINQCTLMLNNIEHKFDAYDFTDAVIMPYIGLNLSETIEYLKKGYFVVDEPITAGSIIYLSTLDNMNKFDTPFSDVDQLFPCTNLQLLQAVCLHCGVSLATVSFTNSEHIINRRPSDDAITCREIVAWIAQMAGCFARCNVDGELELKWYDFEVFEIENNIYGGTFDDSTPYTSGDDVDGGNFDDYDSGDTVDGGAFDIFDRYHHIYALGSATIGTDDVVITGVRVKAMGTESDYGETELFGSNGYVIEISDNPLIQEGNAALIANSVGAKIVGMRFRTCSVTAVSDPSREAGDVAYLTHKNNSYPILITNLSYQIGSLDGISCDAETPSKKQSARFSPQTKTIVEARKIAQQKITAYDLQVQQLTNLIAYGYGMYKSEELQPDGSYKYYMHNKPTIAESSVVWTINSGGLAISTDHGITWGVDTNGNMLVNVLTAIGINATWINAGEIVGIKITTQQGKIGPFTMSAIGLASQFMQFYDDGEYPLLWISKPGTSGGTFDTHAEGSARANYEPSAMVVRSIEGGIETDVTLMARDDLTGRKGQLAIDRFDATTGYKKSEVRVTEEGAKWYRYTGGALSSYTIVTDTGIIMSYNGKSFTMNLDVNTGDLYIQSSRYVYINGVQH